jgi:Co/Zn/Cd efflux system component
MHLRCKQSMLVHCRDFLFGLCRMDLWRRKGNMASFTLGTGRWEAIGAMAGHVHRMAIGFGYVIHGTPL